MKTYKLLVLAVLLISEVSLSQVSFDDILSADNDANWLSYSQNLFNQRHSGLDQVNTDNVDELELQWVWQARSLEKFEATPLGCRWCALYRAGTQ